MKIIIVKVSDIKGCHPRHHDLFIAKTIDELDELKSSMEKNNKLNPIHLMFKEGSERPGYYLVDGLSTYTVAEALGIEELPALIQPWSDDPIDIIIDLNTNDHRSSKELYKMAEAYWKKFSTGQGSRTDITNQVQEVDIYTRIAWRIKLRSGSAAKKYLRIGRTNESFFTNMDIGDISLDKAYRECIAIEKKRNTISNPTMGYVSTTTGEQDSELSEGCVSTCTGEPEFSDSNTTDDTDPAHEFKYKDSISADVKAIVKKLEKLSDEETRIFFHLLSVDKDVCVCCGQKINSDGGEGMEA